MTVWAVCQWVPPGNYGGKAYWEWYYCDEVYQLMEDLGITYVQHWQRGFDSSEAWCVPDNAHWATIIARMRDFHIESEMCLAIGDSPNQTVDAVDLVQRVGSDCMIYEVCAEPHLKASCNCNTNMDTYATRWNQIVTACRDINPTALYGGPAVGISSTSSQIWMNNFLTDCPTTDFATFHYYPAATSQSQALANISGTGTNTLTNITNIYKNMITSKGLAIPLAITEHSPSQTNDWSNDLTFQNQYVTTLFDKCESLGIHSIYMWDFMGYDNLFCMVRPPQSGYYLQTKAQYTAIQNYIGSETTGTKQASFNASLMQQQVKSASFNAGLISQQVVEANFNATFETSPALCSWGTPSVDQWDMFHHRGDVNDDGVIDSTDASLMSAAITAYGLDRTYEEIYDLNHDGKINIFDALFIVGNMGRTICAMQGVLANFDASLQASGLVESSFNADLMSQNTIDANFNATLESPEGITIAPYFATLKKRLENVTMPHRSNLDESPTRLLDQGPELHLDVGLDSFERLKQQFKKTRASDSFERLKQRLKKAR